MILNINKNINCLAAGALSPEHKRDVLIVGCSTSIQVYDLIENKDLFYREVPDGVHSLLFTVMTCSSVPLILVGENCSIQGFDYTGEERYWNVSGDVVTTMEVCDIDNDGVDELIVGSADNIIRAFKNEEMIFDLQEPSKIKYLSRIRQDSFAYALQNNQIGVYKKQIRAWKIKHKQNVTAVLGVDFNNDGKCDVVLGFENGRVEVREDLHGTIIFKKLFSASINKVLYADYRLHESKQVLLCTADGEGNE